MLVYVGGFCGYGNVIVCGYGINIVVLSFVFYGSGFLCGLCFEIKCVGGEGCILGSGVVIVIVINFCLLNLYRFFNNGGWCNMFR